MIQAKRALETGRRSARVGAFIPLKFFEEPGQELGSRAETSGRTILWAQPGSVQVARPAKPLSALSALSALTTAADNADKADGSSQRPLVRATRTPEPAIPRPTCTTRFEAAHQTATGGSWLGPAFPVFSSMRAKVEFGPLRRENFHLSRASQDQQADGVGDALVRVVAQGCCERPQFGRR